MKIKITGIILIVIFCAFNILADTSVISILEQSGQTNYKIKDIRKIAEEIYFILENKGFSNREIKEKLIEECLINYRKIMAIDENSLRPRDYLKIAELYYKLGPGYENLALKYARIAEENKLNNKKLKVILGNLLFNLSNYEEAIEYYKQAGEEDNKDGVIVFNLAWAYYKIGESRKAFDLLEKQLKINKGGNIRDKILFAQAIILESIKEYDKAIEKINLIEDKDINVLIKKAQIYIENNQISSAKIILERIKNIDKNNLSAKELLSKIKDKGVKK